MIDDRIRPEVKDLVTDVIKREMGPFGLADVAVSPATDDDGDAVLAIDVRYEAKGAPIDPKVVAGLLHKLRDQLWAVGERRFPFIRHHFQEQQKVVGFP